MPLANGTTARHAPVAKKTQLGFRGFRLQRLLDIMLFIMKSVKFMCFLVKVAAAVQDTSSL
ncbi:hypothetical protein P3T76_001914 [Phytophthora citrophthora]|uniref:Uncharacterized protein n=1 Tax=Phytophthora citrophthora TaxID=4793 RepID=A0AAD9GXE8_9STRA|nr:hypothetical protein P3T76_001914 [Phytophthora citrophthora]